MSENRFTRRQLLGTGAFLGISTLAGCGQVSPPFYSPPKLGRIRVENRDDAPHTVHLLVERDGEIVYWQAVDLEATSTNKEGQTVRDIKTIPRTEWGDVRGDYRVHARLDNDSTVTTVIIDHDAACVRLNVVVHGEPEVPTLALYDSPSREECS